MDAQGSDRNARVAGRVIGDLQKMVVKAFGGKLSEDPLAEEETTHQFEDFLILKGMGPEEIVKCFRRLEKSPIALSSREAIGLTAESTGP